MEFKVKRDFIPIFLINALMLLITACSVLFFITVIKSPTNDVPIGYNIAWLVIVILVDSLFFLLYNSSVIFASCYIVDDKLIYRAGIFKYTMPLDKIAKITKARNYHLSLALSFDRARVLVIGETGKQCVYYISVVDRDKLIKVVKPVDPNIVENNKEIKPDQPEENVQDLKIQQENKKVLKPKTTAKTSTTKKTTTKSTNTKKTSSTSKKSK